MIKFRMTSKFTRILLKSVQSRHVGRAFPTESVMYESLCLSQKHGRGMKVNLLPATSRQFCCATYYLFHDECWKSDVQKTKYPLTYFCFRPDLSVGCFHMFFLQPVCESPVAKCSVRHAKQVFLAKYHFAKLNKTIFKLSRETFCPHFGKIFPPPGSSWFSTGSCAMFGGCTSSE